MQKKNSMIVLSSLIHSVMENFKVVKKDSMKILEDATDAKKSLYPEEAERMKEVFIITGQPYFS